MKIEILTTEHLATFKEDLLKDLAKLLASERKEPRKFLRSKQVTELLNISSGTLVNYRVRRLLNPTKVAGVYYYSEDEIKALLNGNNR